SPNTVSRTRRGARPGLWRFAWQPPSPSHWASSPSCEIAGRTPITETAQRVYLADHLPRKAQARQKRITFGVAQTVGPPLDICEDRFDAFAPAPCGYRLEALHPARL